MDDLIALIPARGGSVRVTNKNLQIVGGLTLVGRKILQLQDAGIKDVYLGSDSEKILDEGIRYGAHPIKRDLCCCDESRSSANAMISDFLSRVDGENKHILWAHCTNPFIYGDDYKMAIDRYYDNIKIGYDSLLSVLEMRSHMWNRFGFPVNYNPYADRHTLAKDLEPVYFQDGGIFIQSYSGMVCNSYFFGQKPFLYCLNMITGYDVNTVDELALANSLSGALDLAHNFLAPL